MVRSLPFLVLLALAPALSTAQTQTLTVNGRHFTLPADTPILVDETPALLSDLLTYPPGLQLRWLPMGADASEGVGTPELVFSYTLIGPATAVSPLEVLGQPITITADTTLEGFDSVDDLAPGDAMIVAGLVDARHNDLAVLPQLLTTKTLLPQSTRHGRPSSQWRTHRLELRRLVSAVVQQLGEEVEQ